MTIRGTTRLAGVLGWPVTQSRSPLLHNHWLRALGIDGAYVPLPVRPDTVEQAIRALPALGFAGANVTIPHKEAAARVADRLDPAARAIGAVNTLVCAPDGTLEGLNTDAPGFLATLRDQVPAWRAEAGAALVLGAGGASRAVVWALLQTGVASVTLVNRDEARARALAADFDPAGGLIVVRPWSELPQAVASAALLVNTTSLGMAGQPPLPLALDPLPATAVVADLVYVPLHTPLLAAARARGLAVADGLGHLIAQARLGFTRWFGQEPPRDGAARALLEADLHG